MSGALGKLTLTIAVLFFTHLIMLSHARADDTFIKLSCQKENQLVIITTPYYNDPAKIMSGIKDGTLKNVYSFNEKVKEWIQKPITCDVGKGQIISILCWHNVTSMGSNYITIKLNNMEIPNQLIYYPFANAVMRIHVISQDETETRICPLYGDNTINEDKCIIGHIKNGHQI